LADHFSNKFSKKMGGGDLRSIRRGKGAPFEISIPGKYRGIGKHAGTSRCPVEREGTEDRDMKIEHFFHSIHFAHWKVKTHIVAVLLILSAFLAFDFCLASDKNFPQSISILYSNNINAEIDPCPV
jgi:hypothetical protein